MYNMYIYIYIYMHANSRIYIPGGASARESPNRHCGLDRPPPYRMPKRPEQYPHRDSCLAHFDINMSHDMGWVLWPLWHAPCIVPRGPWDVVAPLSDVCDYALRPCKEAHCMWSRLRAMCERKRWEASRALCTPGQQKQKKSNSTACGSGPHINTAYTHVTRMPFHTRRTKCTRRTMHLHCRGCNCTERSLATGNASPSQTVHRVTSTPIRIHTNTCSQPHGSIVCNYNASTLPHTASVICRMRSRMKAGTSRRKS